MHVSIPKLYFLVVKSSCWDITFYMQIYIQGDLHDTVFFSSLSYVIVVRNHENHEIFCQVF